MFTMFFMHTQEHLTGFLFGSLLFIIEKQL